MVPKGGISGFLWIEFVVRWGAFLELFISRDSQKNADLFYHKPNRVEHIFVFVHTIFVCVRN